MVLRPKPKPISLEIQYRPPGDLKPDPANARKHPQRQLAALKGGVAKFGFTNPILHDERDVVIAGHARLEAATALGLVSVPCIRLSHLSAADKKALALADNKLGDLSTFDPGQLAKTLGELVKIDYPVELTGFTTAEVDICVEPLTFGAADKADQFDAPAHDRPAVSRLGDLWALGDHRLTCADALNAASYEQLLGEQRAQIVFADPPYNVPILGHVSGRGRAGRREFLMASGEMSSQGFTAMLSSYMGLAVRFSIDGSMHYHCMDWRHLQEILTAGASVYTELKALCVWNKTNGGMGTLYRSKHELVLVYKNGSAAHINNVDLGRHGRWRTNVWDYAGANTFRKGRDEDLEAHPTVKPISLVADVLRDCSKKGSLVLDPFSGSGTTILAAERTGRKAVAIELDPLYVDVAVRRWQSLTGRSATLEGDGRSFEEIAVARQSEEAAHG